MVSHCRSVKHVAADEYSIFGRHMVWCPTRHSPLDSEQLVIFLAMFFDVRCGCFNSSVQMPFGGGRTPRVLLAKTGLSVSSCRSCLEIGALSIVLRCPVGPLVIAIVLSVSAVDLILGMPLDLSQKIPYQQHLAKLRRPPVAHSSVDHVWQDASAAETNSVHSTGSVWSFVPSVASSTNASDDLVTRIFVAGL